MTAWKIKLFPRWLRQARYITQAMISFCTGMEHFLPSNKLQELCRALGDGRCPLWTDGEIAVKRQWLSLATEGVGSGKDPMRQTGAEFPAFLDTAFALRSPESRFHNAALPSPFWTLEQALANSSPPTKSCLLPIFIRRGAKNYFYIFKYLGKNQKKKTVSWHMKIIWNQILVHQRNVLENSPTHSFVSRLLSVAASYYKSGVESSYGWPFTE